MKIEGGREAGKCSKVVPDRGDRGLFIFLLSRRLFFNVFPFPVCKAQLIAGLVSDPYSFFTDPDPDPEDPDGGQYGSGYGSGSNPDPGL